MRKQVATIALCSALLLNVLHSKEVKEREERDKDGQEEQRTEQMSVEEKLDLIERKLKKKLENKKKKKKELDSNKR